MINTGVKFMFSIYKVSSFAIIAAISATVLMSTSSIAATTSKAEAAPMTIAFAETISRNDARQMVRSQLKDNGKRHLRVGQTVKRKGSWIVSVNTASNIFLYKVKIDAVSGEMSRA